MNDLTLTIKGLFGHFDYEIPLYGLGALSDGLTMSDGVTILTGPNGYGKSTILRMLEAIGKGNWEFFRKLKFKELSLSHDEEKAIFISKYGENLSINGEMLFTFPIDRLSTADFVRLYREQARHFRRFTKQVLSDTFMVSEQRLLEIQDVPLMYDGKPLEVSGKPVIAQKVKKTVAGLPEKLKGHFSAASNHYAETDGKLNASFPTRILNQSDTDRLTEAEFGKLYQDMNAKLQALQENGLSDVAQQDIPAFQGDKAGILRIFFDDFNEKYKLYEPLVQKLTLFRKILDRRFRNFKRVEISREYGLRVRDIREDGDGADVIPLDKLSSGEQETLVLYYQLIFETAPKTMLLIDEPEISLHIAWQRTFIDELKEIVRLNQLRAVVATHSASIIGRHRDIQIDLGALYQDELERQEELRRQGA